MIADGTMPRRNFQNGNKFQHAWIIFAPKRYSFLLARIILTTEVISIVRMGIKSDRDYGPNFRNLTRQSNNFTTSPQGAIRLGCDAHAYVKTSDKR